jgi:hypothetical protein
MAIRPTARTDVNRSAVLAQLGAQAEPAARTEVLPDYQRLPDAELTLRQRTGR